MGAGSGPVEKPDFPNFTSISLHAWRQVLSHRVP